MELRPRVLSAWRTPRLSARVDRAPSDGELAELPRLTDDSRSASSPVRPNHSNQKFLPLLTKAAVCAPVQAAPLIASQISDRTPPAKPDSIKTPYRSAAEDSVHDNSLPCSTSPQAQILSSPALSVEDEVPLTQASCQFSLEAGFSPAKIQSVPSASSSEPEVTGLTLPGLQTAQIVSSPASSVADETYYQLSLEAGLSATENKSVPVVSSSPQVPGLLLSGLQTARMQKASGINCCVSAPPPLAEPNLTESETMLQPPAKRQRKSRKPKGSSDHVCMRSPYDASNSKLPSVKSNMSLALVKTSCSNSGLHCRALSQPAEGNGMLFQPPPRFSAMLVKPNTPTQCYQSRPTGRDAANSLEVIKARAIPNAACILPRGSSLSAHAGKAQWLSTVGSGSSSSSATTVPISQELCPSFSVPTGNCSPILVSEACLSSEMEGRDWLHARNFKPSSLGCLQQTSCRSSGLAAQGVPHTTAQDQPDPCPSRFSAMLSPASTQNRSTEKLTLGQGKPPELPAEETVAVFQPENSPSKMYSATFGDHVEKALQVKEVTPARNPEDNLRAQIMECLRDPKFQALVSEMEQVLEKELGGIGAMRCGIAERFHQNRKFASYRMEQ